MAKKKRASKTTSDSKAVARWTFLTNHSHVLIRLNEDPQSTLREVAQSVGITERAVLRIVQELVDDGFLERERVGRRNEYRVLADQPLRHSIEAHCCIGDILKLIESKRPK
ncbi:MAG: helix-turn-helix transcriptional regulator [Planctomycetaceae bacterium]